MCGTPLAKREFLRQLEDEINYYCEDHGDADLSELEQRFGVPEDIARDCQTELDVYSASKANSRAQNRFKFVAITVLIAVIVLVASVEIGTRLKQRKIMDIFYIDEIIYEGELSTGATAPSCWSEIFSN